MGYKFQMKDFSLRKYKQLLKVLQSAGFFFMSFEQLFQSQKNRFIVLRHDVDKLPENSLKTAKIEHELGIKGTYYFRIVPESYDEIIIKQIADLGHEIGYHYEDVSLVCSRKYVVSSMQKSEDRSQISEVRGQKSKVGRLKLISDICSLISGKDRRDDGRNQMSDVRKWMNGKTEEWKDSGTMITPVGGCATEH